MYQTFRFQRVVLLGAAIGTAGLVFAAPQCCARALQQGLALCGGPLLVSLFPFLIVSALLMRCGAGQVLGFVFRPVARLIGVRSPAAGGVLLIGFLGGFAPAAAAVAEAVRSRELTPQEASALLPGLHQLRAVLRDPHGRGAAAGQPGAGHPPVCCTGAGRVSYRRFAEPSAPGTRCPGTLCAVHPDCAAPVGRSDRTGGCAVPEIVRIRVVFPDAGSRVRAVSARRVGTLPGHAAGGVLRLRLCGPHRPVGQQSVLCRPQRTGGVGAAAGTHPLPRRSPSVRCWQAGCCTCRCRWHCSA